MCVCDTMLFSSVLMTVSVLVVTLVELMYFLSREKPKP